MCVAASIVLRTGGGRRAQSLAKIVEFVCQMAGNVLRTGGGGGVWIDAFEAF